MKYAGESCISPDTLPCPRPSGNLQGQKASIMLLRFHAVYTRHIIITSHHREVSVFGLVHHGLLPGAEVHRTLFTCLDFNLDAEDQRHSFLKPKHI